MHLRVSCHLVIGPQCRVGQPPGILDHEYFSHTDRRQEKSQETKTLHSVHLEPQYDSFTVLPYYRIAYVASSSTQATGHRQSDNSYSPPNPNCGSLYPLL